MDYFYDEYSNNNTTAVYTNYKMRINIIFRTWHFHDIMAFSSIDSHNIMSQ